MANNCKIFTPSGYVMELLDTVGYREKLYGKSILENSCGDGNILVEIVRRYILSCRKMQKSDKEIKEGLETDIWGIELEHVHVAQCRKNLDTIAEGLGIQHVVWNIIEGDYLRLQLNRQFHFIIGNPPYIVYRDIEEADRKYLKDHFASCKKGKFDYYYAFVEKALSELTKNGKMSYIIPYSIYKNVYASNLRELIKPYLKKILDYTYQNKFPGITTSSTILVLQKRCSTRFFYIDVVTGKQMEISKLDLEEKWKFETSKPDTGKYRFGDFFYVNNTVATLCNDAFLLENYRRDGHFYVLPNGERIEAELVKPAVSKRRGKNSHNLAIIFPYYYLDDTTRHYTEEEFVQKFPCAVRHLLCYKKRLRGRASDKKALWFEYGRSQAITKINKEKLVMPSITSSKINVTLEEENVIPCAGFFITKKGNYSLEWAKKILESQRFYDYLKSTGIFTTGKSRRITVKDIADYTFENWE